MLENYLLLELVTFAQTGTLAATAKQLHVTQPTVTRGMQKLEADLNVSLFDRQPNRLSLTATGQLAAQKAAALLADQQQFMTTIRNFEQTQRTVTIATTLPGPLYVLAQLPNQANLTITPTLLTPDQVQSALTTRAQQLIFTNFPIQTDTITHQLVGTEHLAVNLNQFMFQANQPTITFQELQGLSFIVLTNIGPWRQVIQATIPDAQFFYQKEVAALAEITKYADFPYFSTNLSKLAPDFTRQVIDNRRRVTIPISDASASMATYAVYLTDRTKVVQPVIDAVKQAWPADDFTTP